ncbi:hypothetical protein DFH11DRAFT_307523 [Phellopilus nigrolimitatus]|nr:hypothetical protein DFH11DRAFT_307523 [Phellopilus nigrolimitatus]
MQHHHAAAAAAVARRLARQSVLRPSTRRGYAQKRGEGKREGEGEGKEKAGSDVVRAPWVFAGAHVLRVVLPAGERTRLPVYPSLRTTMLNFSAVGFAYGVFWHDFGEGEHVFMPARRWLARQRAAFFTLSPAERRLGQADDAQPGGQDPDP